MALAWVAIFAAGFILFTFRDNFSWVAQRLKSEAIGLAISLELPLVLVDVQRGGPSTGMPTKPVASVSRMYRRAPLAALAAAVASALGASVPVQVVVAPARLPHAHPHRRQHGGGAGGCHGGTRRETPRR